MKKVFVIVAGCLLLAGLVKAETWHTANAVTVGWDATPKIVDTDVIKYQLYISSNINEPIGSIAAYGEEITATESVIKFDVEGKYLIGVESIRYPQGQTDGIKSETISWSNNSNVCANGLAFGVVYYIRPSNISGLRFIGK